MIEQKTEARDESGHLSKSVSLYYTRKTTISHLRIDSFHLGRWRPRSRKELIDEQGREFELVDERHRLLEILGRFRREAADDVSGDRDAASDPIAQHLRHAPEVVATILPPHVRQHGVASALHRYMQEGVDSWM